MQIFSRNAQEKAMSSRFEQQKFHDFILAQGLLPPDLQRKAVMQDFVSVAASPVKTAQK